MLAAVEVEVDDELLPHAARATLAPTVARASGTRRRALFMRVMSGGSFSCRGYQLPLPELVPELAVEVVPVDLLALEAPPAVLAPESLSEVATSVPLEFFKPWITTASPG